MQFWAAELEAPLACTPRPSATSYAIVFRGFACNAMAVSHANELDFVVFTDNSLRDGTVGAVKSVSVD